MDKLDHWSKYSPSQYIV